MAIQTIPALDVSRALPAITTEWQRWIQENISRGCSTQSMVDTMVNQGFDPEQARQAIARKQTALTSPADWMDGSAIRTSDRTIRIVGAHRHPRILVLADVLSSEECDQLIAASEPRLKDSTTVDRRTGEHKVIKERTSQSTYHPNQGDLIERINRRCAEIMHLPLTHGEDLQVVRYRQGGEYRPHWDYFTPGDPGSVKQMAHGGQRVSTLILYLNDVAEGGATAFPKLNFKVFPRKGHALYFHYTDAQGNIDPATLHAGEPVLGGEKWIATKWMRQAPRF